MTPSPAFFLFSTSLLCVAACLMFLLLRALMARGEQTGQPDPAGKGWFFLVLALGLLFAGYFVYRYSGLWTENDTATITMAIVAMLKQGKLLPTLFAYQHGFGYQSVSLSLIYFTGFSTQILQTMLYPFVAIAGLILTSFVFFREVLRDPRAAALASVLLIFQPEVLFVTLRGSHEKITWPLMMVALTFLYRSFGQPLRRLAVYGILFYFVVFAIDSTNVFFGSVFLMALVMGMTLGFFLFRFWRNNRPPLPRADVQRLMYISLSGGILIFIFMAYIYPPAFANLLMLRGILDQLSALLLSFEIKASPYGYISIGWINSQVYLALTVFTWLVIGCSFLVWLRHGWKMIHGETAPGLVENLDWLLYTGFAIQIGISILVDFSGALAANMQLRLFPSFTVAAIVLLVRFIRKALSSTSMPVVQKRLVLGFGTVLSAWFTLASVLKATSEPLLSNKWIFYLPPEKAVVAWVDSHLTDADLWTGVDERFATINNSYFLLDSTNKNHIRFGKVNPGTRFVLTTELERLRLNRLGIQILPVEYWDQIYDNGQAQVDRIPLYFLGAP